MTSVPQPAVTREQHQSSSLADTIRNTIRRLSFDLTSGSQNHAQNYNRIPHHHHDFHDLGSEDVYENAIDDDEPESRSIPHSATVPVTPVTNDDTDTAQRHGFYQAPHAATTSQLFAAPPLTPLTLVGYGERTKNRLLSPALAEEIRHLLPLRLQLYDTWRLCYSLEQHGVSLTTLYSLSVPPRTASRPGYVLIVEDKLGGIFGAYLNEYPHPTKNGRYYGNGECFLWKSRVINRTPNASTASLAQAGSDSDTASIRSVNIQFRAFPYTGINDYMILCEPGFLSVGGGDGKYGLYLDDRFDKGISNSCPAFGNEPLSECGTKFGIVGVEVWRISSI
ncbi:TLD-domain-containing protein [Lipomyces orientalis]|uniref:TLD-domain-containing protein n=1 Tax=Lipomyces orientalis TaxID=1233043 RepID=A0ACC3TEM7_9ASCO